MHAKSRTTVFVGLSLRTSGTLLRLRAWCDAWSVSSDLKYHTNTSTLSLTHADQEKKKQTGILFSANWKSIEIHPPWKRVTFSHSLPMIRNKLCQTLTDIWRAGGCLEWSVKDQQSMYLCSQALILSCVLCVVCVRVCVHLFVWPRAHTTVGCSARGPCRNSLIREAYLP